MLAGANLAKQAGNFLAGATMTTTVAVIVAAGRGTRAQSGATVPKQYQPLAGEPVLSHSLRLLTGHPQIDATVVVIDPRDSDLYRGAAAAYGRGLLPAVNGGATRQASVLAGLEAVGRRAPSRVLIHDAARPFLTTALVSELITALDVAPGAIAAERVSDTLKQEAADGTIARTVDRAGLWRAQTPQAFRYDVILDAHLRAAAAGRADFTDDAGLAEWAGVPVRLVASSGHNMKLTTAADIELAERMLAPPGQLLEPRNGTGFDVHRFATGDHVWLCGVKIPHTHRLEGHSDADVGLHALTDALLGAIGDGDIGEHFPPSEPAWRGAASRIFLLDAAKRVSALGGRIANVDVTFLCEAPKVGPHRLAMREAVAGILGIEAARVGIKATTMEGLGFIGRGEGIAAMASATVLLPVRRA